MGDALSKSYRHPNDAFSLQIPDDWEYSEQHYSECADEDANDEGKRIQSAC